MGPLLRSATRRSTAKADTRCWVGVLPTTRRTNGAESMPVLRLSGVDTGVPNVTRRWAGGTRTDLASALPCLPYLSRGAARRDLPVTAERKVAKLAGKARSPGAIEVPSA